MAIDANGHATRRGAQASSYELIQPSAGVASWTAATPQDQNQHSDEEDCSDHIVGPGMVEPKQGLVDTGLEKLVILVKLVLHVFQVVQVDVVELDGLHCVNGNGLLALNATVVCVDVHRRDVRGVVGR